MISLPGTLRGRLVVLIGAGLVVASICNGAVFYLKRIGLLDHASYLAYWSAHCDGKYTPESFAITASCPCADIQDSIENTQELEDSKSAYLYRSTGYEIALKLVKDVFAAGFILLSLFTAAPRHSQPPRFASSWPLLVLAGIVLAGFALSYANYGAAFAILGLRPYLFLAVALTGSWIAGDLGVFARCIALLLGIELLLMPFEFAFGMHIHGHFGDSSFVRRLSGTLVAPNSFGIFAVAALAFYHAFSQPKDSLWPLVAIVAILVAASGSATAWLVLLLFLLALSAGRTEKTHPVVAFPVAVILCLALLWTLPTLVGRVEVFDSVFGPGARMDEILSEFRSGPELLIGNGLGVSTNAAMTLQEISPALLASAPANVFSIVESTAAALIRQSGLPGLLAFYLVLAWAFWRDGRARIFYAVIALSSLTAKINELFPVNFLLGVALAHSAQCAAKSPGGVAAGERPDVDRR
jgi:hypothetical protein